MRIKHTATLTLFGVLAIGGGVDLLFADSVYGYTDVSPPVGRHSEKAD